MHTINGGADAMETMFGALMVFSVMLLVFFGLPLLFFYMFSRLFPAKIEPQMEPLARSSPETQENLGYTVKVKKIKNKGNIIWVDATE